MGSCSTYLPLRLWYTGAVRDHPLAEYEASKLSQRQANERAEAAGQPLPYPNIWDELDPTKLDRGASPEEVHRRYLEFRKLCTPPECKRHTI